MVQKDKLAKLAWLAGSGANLSAQLHRLQCVIPTRLATVLSLTAGYYAMYYGCQLWQMRLCGSLRLCGKAVQQPLTFRSKWV